MIVCLSGSWKFKQSCDMHRVSPRTDASIREIAYLPAIRSAWLLAECGVPSANRRSLPQGYRRSCKIYQGHTYSVYFV